MDEFITPPKHIAFIAKKLCGETGKIKDCSIAYLAPGGGGPTEPHTHPHNHFFIVTKGEARIQTGEQNAIVKKDEAYLVEGSIPHAIWNNSNTETVMIGISIITEENS